MPPIIMNEQAINQSMTKSATGTDISPIITSSSSSTIVQSSTVVSKTPHNVPPLLINEISNASSNLAAPIVSAHQQNPNFPRGTRNRQTFHGKTEHTKVYFIKLIFFFFIKKKWFRKLLMMKKLKLKQQII